jgi:hypothetical protein
MTCDVDSSRRQWLVPTIHGVASLQRAETFVADTCSRLFLPCYTCYYIQSPKVLTFDGRPTDICPACSLLNSSKQRLFRGFDDCARLLLRLRLPMHLHVAYQAGQDPEANWNRTENP